MFRFFIIAVLCCAALAPSRGIVRGHQVAQSPIVTDSVVTKDGETTIVLHILKGDSKQVKTKEFAYSRSRSTRIPTRNGSRVWGAEWAGPKEPLQIALAYCIKEVQVITRGRKRYIPASMFANFFCYNMGSLRVREQDSKRLIFEFDGGDGASGYGVRVTITPNSIIRDAFVGIPGDTDLLEFRSNSYQ